jgi:hypothetical protein
MAQWRRGGLDGHPRRASILHAVAEHDNGWREVDMAPTVDAEGRLHDFVSAPLDLRQGVWPRAIPARPYRSVADVTATLAGARWTRVSGTISGGRPPN